MVRPRDRDGVFFPGSESRGSGLISKTSSQPDFLFRLANTRRQEFVILLLDAAAIALAFYAAYLVRFEGHIPSERSSQFYRCLPVLLAIRLVVYVLVGIHRWSFRLSGFH